MGNIFFDFSNKSVLVLGGSRGIGLEICQQFVNSGAHVTSIARNKNPIPSVNSVLCDVLNDKKLQKTLSGIVDIDILINVAATNLCEKIEVIDVNEWDRVLDTNLKSYFLAIKHASKIMKKNKGGKIVNVSSIAGRNRSIVSGVHYTASKYGIVGLTKQVSQELAEYNINVNCTCPSQTMTDMLKKSMNKEAIDRLTAQIPAKRIASVFDQAMPVLFLCSDAASYMHGSIIDVNGGLL